MAAMMPRVWQKVEVLLQYCHSSSTYQKGILVAMTILLLALAVLSLLAMISTLRSLRSDDSHRPPRHVEPFGTSDLPSTPYALR
jgi:hypothetical protein